MSIKPKILDGAPKEPGYYFNKCPQYKNDNWTLTEVYNEDGRLVAKNLDNYQDFTLYTWSERIAEPTTDVDNSIEPPDYDNVGNSMGG